MYDLCPLHLINKWMVLTQQFWFPLGQNLIEDVVVSLSLELIGDAGFLQQI